MSDRKGPTVALQANRYPEDEMLIQMGAQSYVGLRLHDSKGEQIGLIMFVHTEPLTSPLDPRSTLKLFGSRAAAELERISAAGE